MKKAIIPFLFTAAVIMAYPAASHAQAYDAGSDTIVLSGDEQGEPVAISRDDSYPRGFTISVGGYQVGFAGRDGYQDLSSMDTPAKHRKKTRKYYKGRLAVINFGFNDLTNVSYKGYSADERGFLDLKNGKSIYFAVNPFRTSAPITRDGKLGFTAGVGLVWRNYTFDNPLTLTKVNGRIEPLALDPHGLKKSKLTTVSINIPVTLDLNFSRSFFISGGVYGGMVIGSHTKYKKPKTKSKHGNSVEMFDYGVTLRAGFSHFHVFANHGLNDLFKSGPSARTTTIGFGFPF